jgi:hypothetical protein
MSDDERLRAAGARWRARQEPPPQVTGSGLSGGRDRSRRLLPVAAAAVAATVVTGVVLAVVDTPGPETAVPPPAKVDPADLVVHDGDTVEVSGLVSAPPDRPAGFCLPAAQTLPGLPEGVEPPPPSCPDDRRITVTGVDVNRLSRKETRRGMTFGYATLRGVWRHRTIEVTEQYPHEPGPQFDGTDDDIPCPRPPGDWKTREQLGDARRPDRLMRYVNKQPDRFGAYWVGYVDTADEPPNSGPDWPQAKEIFMVGVADGDVERARTELRPLFGGNLCVTRVSQSQTEMRSVAKALAQVMGDHQDLVLGTAGQGAPEHQPVIELLLLDEAMYRILDGIGFDEFTVTVEVRPVS